MFQRQKSLNQGSELQDHNDEIQLDTMYVNINTHQQHNLSVAESALYRTGHSGNARSRIDFDVSLITVNQWLCEVARVITMPYM